MIRGQAKLEAINILISIIGKRPGKTFIPLLNLIEKIENQAIKAIAKTEDKLQLWAGFIQITKDHAIKYAVFIKEYNKLGKDNKRLFAENKKLTKKNIIYRNWIKNKVKKFLKKKNKRKRMNK